MVLSVINKIISTWLPVDVEFLFSCLTLYLNRSLCLLVRYRVEHSKRNSISMPIHVIFILYFLCFVAGPNIPRSTLHKTSSSEINNRVIFSFTFPL